MLKGQPHHTCMTDDAAERDRNMRGDAAFKAAMLHARRWKRENIRIGVDRRPGTEFPVFVPHGAVEVPRESSIDGL